MADVMRAMQLVEVASALAAADVPAPVAGPGQLRIEVEACGVCRTELHLLDGEVGVAVLPRTLGHQIVGRADDGRRVGVSWLGWTCGVCEQCLAGRENLCPRARFTGREIDGGFAEQAVADERFCFEIPDGIDAVHTPHRCCAPA